MSMPPRLSTSPSGRPIQLFPIAKPQPATPARRRRRQPFWRPALALALTITGLLAASVALHRELQLKQCPVLAQADD